MPADSKPPAVGVSARGWGWRYYSRKGWATKGIDLDIEPGERVLLLGASGSGKSTLLQGIAGVLGGSDEGETEGQLLVNGEAPSSSRGKVGLVLQDPESQVILARVGDEVAFGCENLGVAREEIWRRVPRALDSVGLRVELDRETSRLSGGQKQRLALASILAMQPGLILLDEPTANLDPQGVNEVRDSIQQVLDKTGATLVVIEHRVDVWLSLVNRVVVLAPDGGVLADGQVDDVIRRQGRELSEAGIWIPGFLPKVPNRDRQSGESLLTASDLTIGRDVAVRSGLEVILNSGAATAITGPNGAGKTTLALTLAGLLPPLGGEVCASVSLRNGLAEHPISWRSRDLLTRIGMVFQEPEHQFLKSKVRDELAVGPRALKLSKVSVDQIVDSLLDRLGLGSLAEANPFTLSGGEKRRLSVATLLATKPKVLVLDEPTFGQDSRTWIALVGILLEYLESGGAIALSSHDQRLVNGLAGQEVKL